MKKYELTGYQDMNHTFYLIRNTETQEYFAGYDFMGSQEWVENITDSYEMGEHEALALLEDLESADADDQPKKITLKQYLVKTSIDGEPINRIMTANEIVDLYEQDQLSGVYGEIKVWDITKDEPVRMDLLQMVEPVIAQRRWEEQEYRDYCENERY